MEGQLVRPRIKDTPKHLHLANHKKRDGREVEITSALSYYRLCPASTYTPAFSVKVIRQQYFRILASAEIEVQIEWLLLMG